ncbi:hypothetical protein Tco_0266781 [Tanacetum coccineum]
MSNVLQEKGFGSLPSSTKMNPRDHVKSISTAKVDSTGIRRIGSGSYVISGSQCTNIFYKTIPFPRRLRDYYCDEWKEARELKILETYSIGTTLHDNTLPQKEKDLGRDLAHTRLTVELADRTIKHPRGIAENVLVRIDLSGGIHCLLEIEEVTRSPGPSLRRLLLRMNYPSTEELAVLCPTMVPNSEKLMEVFIGDYPEVLKEMLPLQSLKLWRTPITLMLLVYKLLLLVLEVNAASTKVTTAQRLRLLKEFLLSRDG